MSIYDKPVRVLLREMISSLASQKGIIFSRESAVSWFSQHYPKIKESTIQAHLIRFSTNAPSRLHFSFKPDEDLLFQVDKNHFRLYDSLSDPTPIYSYRLTFTIREQAIFKSSDISLAAIIPLTS